MGSPAFQWLARRGGGALKQGGRLGSARPVTGVGELISQFCRGRVSTRSVKLREVSARWPSLFHRTVATESSAQSRATRVEARIAEWLRVTNGDDVNVADLVCDRHDGAKTALTYQDGAYPEADNCHMFTYAELSEATRRCAAMLREQFGVGEGTRVAVMLPICPEVVVVALALWRLGAVYVPLFTLFGADAIAHRVNDSAAALVIVDAANAAKVQSARALCVAGVDPALLVVDDGEGPLNATNGFLRTGAPRPSRSSPQLPSFWPSLAAAVPDVEGGGIEVAPRAPIVQIYTSGTTGLPKGVVVPARALAAFDCYHTFGLEVRDADRFWNLANPGWAYGLYYQVTSSLLAGHAMLLVNPRPGHPGFDPHAAMATLRHHRITNMAAAPTVYRAMRAANVQPGGGGGGEPPAGGASSAPLPPLALRVASSAGEPLNSEVVSWARSVLGVELRDHYGQTENGMMIINAHHPDVAGPLQVGSAGFSMPGFHACIVARDASGEVVMVENDGEAAAVGEIAMDRRRSPLFWFEGYFRNAERTAERFGGAGDRFFLTGDVATQGADGAFWFSGRNDDVITSSGYRIGPFDVEEALMQSDAVAEAAVVGVPDELRGEAVKAFVVLKHPVAPGGEEEAAMVRALRALVAERVGKHVAPREVCFVPAEQGLPKTPSGKVQRFQLRRFHAEHQAK